MDTRFERRVATRKRLIDAALTLLVGKGFEQTTIDEISQKAGFSKGAFYFHFESKEAMLGAMVEYLGKLGLLWPPFPKFCPELVMTDAQIEAVVFEIWIEARRKPEIRQELLNFKKDFRLVGLATELGRVVQHQVLEVRA